LTARGARVKEELYVSGLLENIKAARNRKRTGAFRCRNYTPISVGLDCWSEFGNPSAILVNILLFHEAVLYSVANEFPIVSELHLLKNSRPIGTDRLGTQPEIKRDLLDAFTRSESIEHLVLTVG